MLTLNGQTGRMLTFNGQSPECDTPQEKSERKREQAREDAEAKKWDLDHPMRYWLAGFCDGGTFTDDFKYSGAHGQDRDTYDAILL